jgi:alpha-beta hydrolase superfamily lysophospholipase
MPLPTDSLRRRSRLWRIAISLGVLVVLWLMISFAAAYRLTHRPRARFAEPAPRVAWGTLENLRIDTGDGQTLGAWFADGRTDAPSVLVLHGNKGSRFNSLPRAGTFAARGCAVLLISMRAHGDSTGEFHDIGFSARHDVLAAVTFLEARRPGRPVIVMGTSMGSAAAAFAAGELGHRVQGFILESPYRDLKTAVWNRTNLYLPPVLSHVAYLGLRLVGPLFLPDLDEISPFKAVAEIPDDVPVLILTGAGDRLARPEEAEALFTQVRAHGQLIVFPDSGHANLPESAPLLFRQTIGDFCTRVAGSRSPG